MPAVYLRPVLLGADHDITAFNSRSPEQTEWAVRHARAAQGARTARVLVATPEASSRVVAYFAWTMAGVAPSQLPARARVGVGRHPQPFALLARLAVDKNHEGQGLGHALVADVISRTVEVSERIGFRGLLVHAEGDAARRFYLHALPEFEPSPTDPLHLVTLVKDLRKSLGG